MRALSDQTVSLQSVSHRQVVDHMPAIRRRAVQIQGMQAWWEGEGGGRNKLAENKTPPRKNNSLSSAVVSA